MLLSMTNPMTDTSTLTSIDQLKVSDELRKDLAEFVSHLIEFYKGDLLSVTAFGSAVAGGYSETSSDLNLLVIYSDLNIADLKGVAKLAQHWLKKRRFMPRFLSARNLANSARYFQIDLMEMRDAHVVLYGQDMLAEVKLCRSDLHWQLSHEIKRMRMRIKQQFWRTAGDAPVMQDILIHRFSSLLHLTRVLLYLEGKPASSSPEAVAEAAVTELGIDVAFVRQMQALKSGELKLKEDDQVNAFSRLMDTVRLVDERVDQVAV